MITSSVLANCTGPWAISPSCTLRIHCQPMLRFTARSRFKMVMQLPELSNP